MTIPRWLFLIWVLIGLVAGLLAGFGLGRAGSKCEVASVDGGVTYLETCVRVVGP